jgi:hypothetical protein
MIVFCQLHPYLVDYPNRSDDVSFHYYQVQNYCLLIMKRYIVYYESEIDIAVYYESKARAKERRKNEDQDLTRLFILNQ